ncbi:MAG TPA: J domain-containing protein [Acidimicrobiales bacterium]|nr:J domain-containing protein [Acidimicrobiales bacterium]
MDVREARVVLGVDPGDGWDVVRASYRRRIRAAHPDTHGVGATATAARLNEAYAVLSRAKRAAVPTATPGGPAPPPPTPPVVGVAVVGGDTLRLAAPPPEAFALLLEAGHQVGEVTYVDRNCSIFEVVLRQDGETCSLVVTIQGRAHGTEAFLTLEAIERPATLDPSRVVFSMAAALGR